MTASPATIELSSAAYQVAWERLDPGPMPLVLFVPPEGVAPEERALVRKAAWAELVRRGVAGEHELRPPLAAALSLLAAPARSVDLRIGIGREAFRALAATDGRSGVLAVLSGGAVTLRSVPAAGIVAALVGLLPAHPAGPGSATAVPLGEVDASILWAEGSLLELAERVRGAGVPAEQARVLASMAVGSHLRGQFGAAGRDAAGERRRAAVVGFYDTPDGRYLLRQCAAHELVAEPADAELVARRVAELLAEVSPEREPVGGSPLTDDADR